LKHDKGKLKAKLVKNGQGATATTAATTATSATSMAKAKSDPQSDDSCVRCVLVLEREGGCYSGEGEG